MEKQREEMDISLLDLWFFFKKRIWVIVSAFVLFAVLGAAYTSFFMPDEYTAVTRMYVLNRSSEGGISSSDYSVSNYMIKDYEVLITGANVTREVVDRLNLKMSPSALAGKISVSAINSTRVLQIVVVDTDPQRAANIANCVREVASTQIKAIMDVDAVNLVYRAEVPAGKSGPNASKNAGTAAVIGTLVTVLILLLVHLLDDTIRTEEDVSNRLGLETLGVIPISKELETTSGKGNAQRKRKDLLEARMFFQKK